MDLREVRRAVVVSFALVLAACSEPEPPPPLYQAVKSGGVLLYMRHQVTEKKDDGPPANFEDCSWQRNLTDKGREVAKETGTAIAALDLPIDSVLASPMCRAMETAKLTFGRATPQPGLRLPYGSTDMSSIRQFFLKVPPPGKIIAIVGHESRGLGFEPMLKEGETAVIRPKDGGHEVIGRIPHDEWARWAKALKR